LWKIPNDLRRFKELTTGHPVIMGSKTYESIGRPLPNRENIVISGDSDYEAEGCRVFGSIPDALAHAQALDSDEVFVIGGGMIYAQTINDADRLYLTLVDSSHDGDTHFPSYEHLPFDEIERTDCTHEGLVYSFVTLDRRVL